MRIENKDIAEVCAQVRALGEQYTTDGDLRLLAVALSLEYAEVCAKLSLVKVPDPAVGA